MVPKLITLEEHFISKGISGAIDQYNTWSYSVSSKLSSIGDERLKDMESGGVNLQVISHAPYCATIDECRIGNNELAKACEENTKRFSAFAMLPMLEPANASAELERCVKRLGFVGALINNHTDGTFYDDERYWPVFEKAVELDVPVYIHPSFPSQTMSDHYKGNYPDQVAFMLSIASWGWHSECGHHILRLFAAGLFDRYPKLKIIIGHDGEMLPFMLDRTLPLSKFWGERQRDLRTVWQQNIWVTTSAMFSLAPFACLLRVSSVDKIMYSVDYPFVPNENGLAFVKELEQSGLVTEAELQMICHGNAEKLLNVKAVG